MGKFHKPLRKLADCHRDGDGLDPKYDRDGPSKVENRKCLQLCGQAQEALTLALADCRDNSLTGCTVLSVEPWPDSSRLLVTVVPNDDNTLPALEGAKGWLRSQIAQAIHRRKTPDLVFKLCSG